MILCIRSLSGELEIIQDVLYIEFTVRDGDRAQWYETLGSVPSTSEMKVLSQIIAGSIMTELGSYE